MDFPGARSLTLSLLVLVAAHGITLAEKQEALAGELLSIIVVKGLDGVSSHRFSAFTVQVGNVIYTGSGKRIHHPLDDYNEGFNAGDAVQAEIRGNEMIIKKHGGRALKTKIMKKVPANESLN